MPMLYFPSSLLSSFASLLIPKIAKEREQNHRQAVAHITGKAVRLALAFGMFFSGVFLLFGDSWGMAFYHSGDAGAYLRVLAPLAPLVYLDVVVDSQTGVNYVTYLASSSAPLSPLLDKDGKPLTDTLPIETL